MSRGTLRVYLGAAPGVGKTFAMLNEGRRRANRGTDVVVGLVESHGRALTEGQIGDLEVVPRRTIDYRGAEFTEMDVDAVLARKPAVVLVDELAHTNVPGSRNQKRWQDVGELMDAGIDVISTVNIQHLESVNDVVERITGVKQQETIPDEIVRAAEQVELVDMTPEALRRRMAHGNIYPPERVDTSLANYFRLGNLAALREIALLWVADKVDESLQQYLEDHGIEGTWETRERVVVALTGAPGGDVLIRRAARMARRAQGDLLGVHVRPSDGLATSSSELLQKHRRLLADVGGSYHELAADDVATGLVRIARGRARHATRARVEQAVALGAPHPRFGDHACCGGRAIRRARDLDRGDRRRSHDEFRPAAWRDRDLQAAPAPGARCGCRRLAAAHPSAGGDARRILAAERAPPLSDGGRRGRGDRGFPSRQSSRAVAGFLLANYYFTEPLYTFTDRGGEQRRRVDRVRRDRRRRRPVGQRDRPTAGRSRAGQGRGGDARTARRNAHQRAGPVTRAHGRPAFCIRLHLDRGLA